MLAEEDTNPILTCSKDLVFLLFKYHSSQGVELVLAEKERLIDAKKAAVHLF